LEILEGMEVVLLGTYRDRDLRVRCNAHLFNDNGHMRWLQKGDGCCDTVPEDVIAVAVLPFRLM
jgi:hypothetical protein